MQRSRLTVVKLAMPVTQALTVRLSTLLHLD
jgi:hypothetical protein